MADTDLPNGFGAIKAAPKPRPRLIASPFGIFAYPAPPDPNQTPGFNVQQTPGFNVQPDAPTPPPNPTASLLATLTPSKQDVASTLGAPVDALAWAAHRMGLPISGDVSYEGSGLGNTGINGQPTWAPGPNVPFSSQNIQNMMKQPAVMGRDISGHATPRAVLGDE
jgi:hypothetical protein